MITTRSVLRRQFERPNGLVLFEGESQLTGYPIVCVLTGIRSGSDNAKTGNMLQTWILSTRTSPIDAWVRGINRDVCGDCPLAQGGCYVNITQAPLAIYNAWQHNRYPLYDARIHSELLRGRLIRFGSYGDPCAVPLNVWHRLSRLAQSWTGYTHQWSDPRFSRYSRYLMASVESESDRAEAQSAGWRTFRSVLPEHAGDILSTGRDSLDVVCPASKEAGARVQCSQCRLCAGTSSKARSVCIVAHGSPATMAQYRKHVLPVLG